MYSNDVDGKPHTGYTGYFFTNTYTIVPGNNWNGMQGTAPYGGWTVRRMWTTQDYANDVLGGDWGIIEVNPDAAGRYPGDVVGTMSLRWGQRFPSGAELYSTGYPASDNFLLAQNGGGNRQYFCQNQWNLEQATDASFGAAYYGINLLPCEMNGGASGGPVFYHAPTGEWIIVGVNNRGAPRGDGFGANMITFWLNDGFGAFWNAVLPQVGT